MGKIQLEIEWQLLRLHHFINQSQIEIIGSILEANAQERENKFQLALFSFAVKLNWVSRAAIKVIAAFLKELPNKFPLIALAIVFRSIQTNLLHRVSIFRFTFSKHIPRNWTGDGEIWTEICETWSRELEIYSWKFPSISDFEWSWCTRNHQESFPTSFKIHEKIGFFPAEILHQHLRGENRCWKSFLGFFRRMNGSSKADGSFKFWITQFKVIVVYVVNYKYQQKRSLRGFEWKMLTS